MASGAVTVPLRDLEKIRLYVTDKKEALTASQVRKRTGADVVVNGTLFDPERWVPNCDVKSDGKVLNDDPYTYRGLGWNSGEGKFHIAVSGEMESYDNFVSGVLLLWQGKPYPYHADAAVSRRSGRSVLLGLTDGSYLLRCGGGGRRQHRQSRRASYSFQGWILGLYQKATGWQRTEASHTPRHILKTRRMRA